MSGSDRLVGKPFFFSGGSLGCSSRHAWRWVGRLHRNGGTREGRWGVVQPLACRDCQRKSMALLRRYGTSLGTGVDLKKAMLETNAVKGNEENPIGDWDPLGFESSSSSGKSGQKNPPLIKGPEIEEQKDQSAGVSLAVSMLKFYKRNISPLLPPGCRYLPTCSEYAMDSFKKFGVAKGGVLTAWRVARCNPFGGSGYDPPKWPPPGLEWLVELLERKYVGESIFLISCVIAAAFALEQAHPF